MMATVVYSLSSLTCMACAYLLLRAWKCGGARLLLYSGLCFVGLAINNLMATVDINTATEVVDLSSARLGFAFLSFGVLIFGLAWESV